MSVTENETRAAIVCTLRMPSHSSTVTRSFVEYHKRIGFSHMFLFFDVESPSEAYVALSSVGGVLEIFIFFFSLREFKRERERVEISSQSSVLLYIQARHDTHLYSTRKSLEHQHTQILRKLEHQIQVQGGV